MEQEDIYRFLQEFLRKRPMLVVGTGLSVSMGLPGMDRLSSQLKTTFSKDYFRNDDILTEWEEVSRLIHLHGLEGGLLKSRVSEYLLTAIVEETASFVNDADSHLRDSLYSNPVHSFPFARLLDHLVNSLHPMNPVLDVITSNYDHVIEYACDRIKVKCCSGFCGALVQRFSPDELENTSFEAHTVEAGRGLRKEYKPQTKVRLLKPHGSLWWQKIEKNVFQSPVKLPSSQTLIVTPGLSKYESSLIEPVLNHHREKANDRLRKAGAVMVIGYGFNDDHLQTVLMERLSDGTECLILTRTLSETALAAVSSCPQIFALEQDDNGETKWHYNGTSGNTSLQLWDLEVFTQTII